MTCRFVEDIEHVAPAEQSLEDVIADIVAMHLDEPPAPLQLGNGFLARIERRLGCSSVGRSQVDAIVGRAQGEEAEDWCLKRSLNKTFSVAISKGVDMSMACVLCNEWCNGSVTSSNTEVPHTASPLRTWPLTPTLLPSQSFVLRRPRKSWTRGPDNSKR